MSDEDRWPRWFGRRRFPFFRESIFGDIDEVFRDMEEMMEREFKEFSKRAPKELIRERTLPDGSKVQEWGPFVYGYSVKIGPNGKPQIREFGNIEPGVGPGRPRIDIKDKREPLTDIMETDGEVNVIVELPGVDKEDIQIHSTDNTLTVSVDTPQRKYRKEIELPTAVDPKQAKATYKNGVLEVSLQKRKKEKPKGEPIPL